MRRWPTISSTLHVGHRSFRERNEANKAPPHLISINIGSLETVQLLLGRPGRSLLRVPLFLALILPACPFGPLTFLPNRSRRAKLRGQRPTHPGAFLIKLHVPGAALHILVLCSWKVSTGPKLFANASPTPDIDGRASTRLHSAPLHQPLAPLSKPSLLFPNSHRCSANQSRSPTLYNASH
jgi:hypothetical protein